MHLGLHAIWLDLPLLRSMNILIEVFVDGLVGFGTCALFF